MSISLVVGFLVGCAAGLLNLATNVQGKGEYFDDGFYWRNYDGIQYQKNDKQLLPPESPAHMKPPR